MAVCLWAQGSRGRARRHAGQHPEAFLMEGWLAGDSPVSRAVAAMVSPLGNLLFVSLAIRVHRAACVSHLFSLPSILEGPGWVPSSVDL